MSKCKYYLELDGRSITLNGDKELSEFIKDNIKDEASPKFKVKYSLTANNEQNKTLDALTKVSEYISSTIDPNENSPYKFLTKKQNIRGKEEFLVPVFDSVNYEKELKEDIREELKGATEEVINAEFKLRLKTNKFMETLSISLGSIFRNRLNYKLGKTTKSSRYDIKEIVKEILKFNDSIHKNPLEHKDEEIDDYSKKILDVIDNKIQALIDSSGIIKVNQSISVRDSIFNSDTHMSAASHILNIDDDGICHIFEIKTSEKPYQSWDTAKKRHTDYILGIKRQLLSNFVDTSKTTLNILNITIPKMIDGSLGINGISIYSDIERTSFKELSTLGDKVEALNYTKGPVTTLLRKLLPSKLVTDKKISSKLVEDTSNFLKQVFPTYEFKSKLIAEVEPIVKNAIKNSKDQSEVYFYDRLSTHNEKVIVSKSTPNWETEFTEKVEEYIKRWNEDKDSKVVNLVKEIKKLKQEGNLQWNSKNSGTNGVIEQLLSKYLHSDWTILNSNMEELNQLNILLFHNSQTNTIEAVSITINPLNKIHNLGFGNSILGKFKTNQQTQNKDILSASSTNIEIMKVLATINNLKEPLLGQALAGISVLNLNPFNDKGDYILNINNAVNNFNQLIEESNKKATVLQENNFKNQNIKIADFFLDQYHKIILNPFFSNSIQNKGDISKLADLVRTFDVGTNIPADAYNKLQWFKQLRETMLNPENGFSKKLREIDQKKIQDMSDPVNYIYGLVSEGIYYYNNLSDVFDYNVPKYGTRSGDLTHYFKSSIFGSAPDIDENGNKIVGILQGSQFTTTDTLQSISLKKMHDLIAIAQDKITSDFQAEHAIIGKSTENFYKTIGRSWTQRILIGGADKYNKVFFETDKNTGVLTHELKFKNPWSSGVELDNTEREYLKNILFALYKNSNLNKRGVKTIQELEKSEEFFEIEQGISTLFYAPLVKKSGTSKWIPENGDIKKFLGRTWDDVKDILDPKAQTEEERIRSYNSINAFREIHNQYDLKDDIDFRNSLIEKYGTEHFEINIDTIASKYLLEHIREKYLNSIMLDIHSAMTVLKMHGSKTGNIKEIEDAMNDFWDQMKLSVYNTSIIEGEGRDLIAVIKKAQRVVSIMTIALRPFLLAKELTVGLFKNSAFAFYKTYGDDSFGESDLMKGYMTVLDPTSDTYILNDAINLGYRIANSDLIQLANKKKYDRFGLNFLSDNMYWFSTAPDYVNRLSLFFAKMHKDGCYDAHSMGEMGNLEYNPKKDKRYSYYLSNRNLYFINGKYNYSPTDIEYNRQKSLYISAIEEHNKGNLPLNLPMLTEEDMLPKAYTTVEINGFRTFSDLAYGNYDHTRSPLILGKVAGILFGQFLRFYPSRVQYYLGKPVEHSTKGYMGQKYQLDENNNKIMLWKKEEFLEDGSIIVYEVPESELDINDIRKPATGWVGSPSEGILYSLSYTIREVLTGNLDKATPWRVKQAKIALHDLLLSFLLMWLGIIMIGDKKEYKEKTEMERTIMKLGLKTASELNFITTLLFSVKATPAFIDILGNLYADISKFLSGDLEIAKLIRRNIRMLELFPSTMGK